MSPKPDDLEMLINKFRNMNIEELKVSIDQWEKDFDCTNRLQILDIAKNELELKYKERKEQIELLTKSLTSSSRVSRWISSIRAILKP
jgi:hypothetical protein|tara:strand:- start:705 stop:968 length:264 start_codon:yes stop_codon:yes gene_type:complete